MATVVRPDYRSDVALRIIVGEDSLLVREGITRLVSSAPDLEVVASCADDDELVAAVGREHPDVVLTDIRMPPTWPDEGVRLANALRESDPAVGVVALSQYSDPAYVLALFELGSDRRAYLLKERLRDRAALSSAIRSVAAGGSAVDPKVIEVRFGLGTDVDISRRVKATLMFLAAVDTEPGRPTQPR